MPILIFAMPLIVGLIGNGTLAAIAAFTLVGLTAGHLLGGPSPEYRTAPNCQNCQYHRHPVAGRILRGAMGWSTRS
jgi:hypothetical protein